MAGGLFKDIGIAFAATLAGVIAVFVSIIAIFFFAILGALIGAVTGWIVSITPILGDLVIEGFLMIGIKYPNLIAIGAMLGFVAGFFKQNNSKCDCCVM